MAAFVIFIVTYLLIGIQRIPRLHIDRPAGALLGATGMVLFGVLTLQEAYSAIDLDTLMFLLGMMILLVYLEMSGFFEVLERAIIGLAKSQRTLLALVVLSAGLLSAVFMNDTICLLYTPVLVRVVRRLELNPVPYLIALATSANIGSVMSMIGNPQNALIGIQSGIPFLRFFTTLWPVSMVGLGLNFWVIAVVYRKQITSDPLIVPSPRQPRQINRFLLTVSLSASVAFLALLTIGYSPAGVAMGLAAAVIVAGASQPRRALASVDWPLLFFFAGLFVVMRGVEHAGLTDQFFLKTGEWLRTSAVTSSFAVTIASLILSNLISNVPAVMLFVPLFKALGNPERLWLVLAMASTLAGNLTIIGSVANIIVFESARDHAHVGFLEYARVGVPVTLLTVTFGTLWMLRPG